MKDCIKRLVLSVLCLAFPTVSSAKTDVFDFQMTLHVPRVYSNTDSKGYRKYQRQKVSGYMLWHYDSSENLTNVTFKSLVNSKHVMSNGRHVTYDAALGDVVQPRFNIIGSNKTLKFKTPSVCFYLIAEPSYNIGQLDEDNALYVMLSGKGGTAKSGYVKTLSGNVAGTLGCGCTAYGHMSPTRLIGYYGWINTVDDVAAVYGTWKAKLNKKKSGR